MALRAQKKRQGGSSRGGGRPSVVVGPNPAHGTIAPGTPGFSSPTNQGGFANNNGGTTPLAPATPSAPYQRRPAPQATVPTAGPSSTALRNTATSALGIARNQNRDAIFRAVMQLGDPALIAKYQNDPKFSGYNFAQDPNSVFASLARQEQQGLEDIDQGTLSGNTFFSGMRLRDRGRLSDETNYARLAGSTSFEDDLKAYAAALGLAENDYTTAMGNADQMDIDAALEADRIARDQWLQEQAQADAAAAAAAPAPPVVTASAPQAPSPAPGGTITQVSPSTPGHPGVYLQDHGPRAGLQYIMKNGQKWYESKPGKKDWGKGGKIGMTP